MPYALRLLTLELDHHWVEARLLCITGPRLESRGNSIDFKLEIFLRQAMAIQSVAWYPNFSHRQCQLLTSSCSLLTWYSNCPWLQPGVRRLNEIGFSHNRRSQFGLKPNAFTYPNHGLKAVAIRVFTAYIFPGNIHHGLKAVAIQ